MKYIIGLVTCVLVGCSGRVEIERKTVKTDDWRDSADFRIKAIQEQRRADIEEIRKRFEFMENNNDAIKQKFADNNHVIDLLIQRINKLENKP